MRYVIPAFAAVLLALSPIAGHAQTATPAPAQSATPAPHVNRMAQRFAAANTTNDGHLTLDQAKAAKWTQVVKNFSTIDSTHKGYVTKDDIRAAAQAHRAAKLANPATNG
jgi:hypothetical protein